MKKNIKENPRQFDLVFDIVMRHPYIFISLACLIMLPLGFAQVRQITSEGIVIEALMWIVVLGTVIFIGKPSGSMKVNVWLFASSVAAIILYSMMVSENEDHSVVMFIPALFILVQLAIVMWNEKLLNTDRVIMLMMILAVVARYCFVLKFDSTTPYLQHDIGNFKGTAGHEAYIMYWYKNGLVLPEFDVTALGRWQFYHPPLHHILMAAGMKIFTTLGLPLEWAQQAIQILPMIYSALSMVACYRIFKLVKLEGAGLVVAMIFPCFYPTFIIWSGAYNNDMLTATFMLFAILWTLKWYRNPKIFNIIPIALCLGLGMMTKLSAWMVAPAIAVVFIWVFIRSFIKDKKKLLPLLGQFASFLVVSVPPAFWWGIRNYVKFGTPLTFVSEQNFQWMSVEKIPASQRLFDFSLSQLDYPFLAFKAFRAPYNEYNPFMGLVKTSVFDEYRLPWYFSEMAVALVYIFAITAVVSFGFLVYIMFKKGICGDLTTKIFFMVTLLTIIVSYYYFCFEYPYVCTENIRYCIPIIPILAMGLGFGVNTLKSAMKNQNKKA